MNGSLKRRVWQRASQRTRRKAGSRVQCRPGGLSDWRHSHRRNAGDSPEFRHPLSVMYVLSMALEMLIQDD